MRLATNTVARRLLGNSDMQSSTRGPDCRRAPRSAGALMAALAAFGTAACAPSPQVHPASPPSSVATRGAVPSATPSDGERANAPRCEVVCENATVVRHEITPDESADYYTTQAVDRANATLNAMNGDLLACYEARVKLNPKAHAFLTVDIVVGADGHVQNVETQGGALLGPVTMRCIVDRIKRGEFAAPPRGGTMRFEVPVTLRRLGPDQTI